MSFDINIIDGCDLSNEACYERLSKKTKCHVRRYSEVFKRSLAKNTTLYFFIMFHYKEVG